MTKAITTKETIAIPEGEVTKINKAVSGLGLIGVISTGNPFVISTHLLFLHS
jgi:hypothetical protein